MSEAKNISMKKQMQKSLKNLGDSGSSEFQAMSDQFQSELNGFYNLFEAYVDNASNAVEWDKVNPPAEDFGHSLRQNEWPRPLLCQGCSQ